MPKMMRLGRLTGLTRRLLRCGAWAGPVFVATFLAALAGAGFGQSSRLARYGGLFQRASIITGFGWLTVVSARALKRA
jgi:hypothetical protein